MSPNILAVGFIIGLFTLLLAGIPIGAVILGLAAIGILVASNADPGTVLATAFLTQMTNWGLTALPLFVLMGELLGRSGIATRLFNSFSVILTGMPGGLVQVNIFACGLFSALSGSSTATVAAISRLSFGQLKRRGYRVGDITGSIAGAGTLGILIPPSVAFILYGFTFNASISELFLAGVLPGFLMLALFCIYVAFTAKVPEQPSAAAKVGISDRLRALVDLLPIAALIVLIFGAIYGGFATPTEAAVVGVVGSLVLAASYRTLTWECIRDSFRGAVVFNAAIAFVLGASAALQVAMAYTGVPRTIVSWVQHAEFGVNGTLLLIGLILIILGCFIDGLSMIVLTGAVLLPLVNALGIDLIWFGVYVVILVEIGLITPPIGFNLFVLQKATGVQLPQLAASAFPYLFLLLVGIALIWMFPGLATYLPDRLL